jgi:hypothetical protein
MEININALLGLPHMEVTDFSWTEKEVFMGASQIDAAINGEFHIFVIKKKQ